MKRTAFVAELEDPIFKRTVVELTDEARTPYALVIRNIVHNDAYYAAIWKNALCERWHLLDAQTWRWGTGHDKKWLVLHNGERVMAQFVSSDAFIYAPDGSHESISETAVEIYGALDDQLWTDAFEQLFPYLNEHLHNQYTQWYELCYINKSTAAFFHGPKSPFKGCWKIVRHLLPALSWEALGGKRTHGLRVETYRPWMQLRRFERKEERDKWLGRDENFSKLVVTAAFRWNKHFTVTHRCGRYWDVQQNVRYAGDNYYYGRVCGTLTPAGFRTARTYSGDPIHGLIILPIEYFSRHVLQLIKDITARGYIVPETIKPSS